MKHLFLWAVMLSSFAISGCSSTKEMQHGNAASPTMTVNNAAEALVALKSGNQRFLDGKLIYTDYKNQIEHTKSDQHPHSVILSCLDSRVPPEIVFDQGIGNIFVARTAGNIEDANNLGSMEFATKVKGSKLIVVMGHSSCGAVKGAIDNAQLGNLTQLVDQIKPAIKNPNTGIAMMLDDVAKQNVKLTMADILKNSPVIAEQVQAGKVKMIGAFYDLSSGKVTFME